MPSPSADCFSVGVLSSVQGQQILGGGHCPLDLLGGAPASVSKEELMAEIPIYESANKLTEFPGPEEETKYSVASVDCGLVT